ncbi:MAG TPA: diaminopimelate epimerase, partial [Acidimicrobiales bacterium]|nr:diaminopimelate epimerase [Acidimicrobiales bacterium]
RPTAAAPGPAGPGGPAAEEPAAKEAVADVDADVTMELWNADGGRAETSGNGLRCLARALIDAGAVPPGPVRVRTDAGVSVVRPHPDGRLSAEMGAADVDPGSWPDELLLRSGTEPVVVGDRRHLRVDMGNPHLVVEVEDPAKVELTEGAPGLRDLNVEVVAAGPGPDELSMRVWERGVGETAACGTGSCAAAVAAHRWGLVGERVTVHQPGGALDVELLPDGSIRLVGPADLVATVEVPWP